jgi:hypothetical protein
LDMQENSSPLGDLLLDPNNYRFQDRDDFVPAAEAKFAEPSVQARAAARLRETGLTELKNSILHNGFLPFERIVVRVFGDKYLVLEGNRRVATLKWLADDLAAGVELPKEVEAALAEVPVVVITDLDTDPALPLSLMGVRHVGGIRPWGAFQRAKLVSELRDTFDLDTGGIAARLGMTAHEVNRRYRAYKALQQMMNDEEYADVAEPDMYPLFHEAVAGAAVKEWLGWNDTEYEFGNADALHDFYELIAPVRSDDRDGPREPKITTHRDVRDLREILPLTEARRRLFDSDASFTDALALAKAENLSNTWVKQIGEAIAALRSVGALELRNLTDENLAELNKLAESTKELLDTHDLIKNRST